MQASLSSRGGWPLRRRISLGAALLLVLLCLAASWRLERALGLRTGPYDYNIAAWELRNFPSKWVYEFGELFRAGRDEAQQQRDLLRFFDLTRSIQALERELDASEGSSAEAAALLEALRGERRLLEKKVEATIEARLTAVLLELGLTRSLPLLGERVWPPVDFEFTEPPRTLATSRRDRIELIDARLLRPDLSLAEVEAIEAETERLKGVSALAFTASGVAAYPAMVAYSPSYAATVEVAAHEWVHAYLFFSPLGFNYYASNDLRAINETVADLVAREVTEQLLGRWPASEASGHGGEESVPVARDERPTVDVGAELRALRAEVDTLLTAGRVEAAEALMEQRRRDLASRGVVIRRLNQAYFAFTNLYAGEAGNPAATNPIGPKVDALRQRSPSLREFVRVVSRVTSLEDLDRALDELGRSDPPSPSASPPGAKGAGR